MILFATGRKLWTVAGILVLLLLATTSCQESKPETTNPPEIGPTSVPTAADLTTPEPEETAAPSADKATVATPGVSMATRSVPTPTTPFPTLSTTTPTVSPTPPPILTRSPAATPTPFPEYTIEDLHADELAAMLSVLDESSTAGDVFALLTDKELDCLQEEAGVRVFAMLTDLPALAFATSPHLLLTACIDPGPRAEVTVAVVGDAVGALKEDEELCLRVGSSFSFLQNAGLLTVTYLDCPKSEIQADNLRDLFQGLQSLHVILGENLDTIGKLISFLRSEPALKCVHTTYTVDRGSKISYEEFQALPPLALINIPHSLDGCGNKPSAFAITAALIGHHSGASWHDTHECLVMEFEESPTLETTIRFPEWRLESAYFKCLTEGEYQDLAVAQMEAFAGELPDENANCAREIAADGYGIAKAIGTDVRRLDGFLSDYKAFPYLFNRAAFSLCLNADQVARILYVPASEIRELTPDQEHCIRTLYQDTVKQLWSEIERPGWTVRESESLAEFTENIGGCTELE